MFVARALVSSEGASHADQPSSLIRASGIAGTGTIADADTPSITTAAHVAVNKEGTGIKWLEVRFINDRGTPQIARFSTSEIVVDYHRSVTPQVRQGYLNDTQRFDPKIIDLAVITFQRRRRTFSGSPISIEGADARWQDHPRLDHDGRPLGASTGAQHER
jgi:hypothetical protein